VGRVKVVLIRPNTHSRPRLLRNYYLPREIPGKQDIALSGRGFNFSTVNEEKKLSRSQSRSTGEGRQPIRSSTAERVDLAQEGGHRKGRRVRGRGGEEVHV